MISRAKLERLDPNRWIGVRAGELLDVLTRAESHDGCARGLSGAETDEAPYSDSHTRGSQDSASWRDAERVLSERST